MQFRLEQVDVFHVAMPLLAPWRTAYGEDSAIHSIVVRGVSGGVEAWGEATPLERPEYSAEWAGGAFETLKCWLAPECVGREFAGAEEISAVLSRFKGNFFAKAALETAGWALEARLSEQPLYRLLGGSKREVEVGADFGVADSLDDLVAAIGRAVDDGFRRVKLKFRPGWDIPMIETVRSHFPDLTVHIDCNSGFTLDDLNLFRSLDRFGLAMIEQPLDHDDLVDHAQLQAAIETPICLDESVTTVRRAKLAAELGSCRYVNVKPGRVGGLGPALAIHDVLRNAGISCWVGSNLESAIGSGIAAALATRENFTYPADIFPTSRLYSVDLASPPLEFQSINGVPHALADSAATDRGVVEERLRCMTVAAGTVQMSSETRAEV